MTIGCIWPNVVLEKVGKMSSTKISTLIEPYGGNLVDLIPTDEKSAELHRRVGDLPSIQISARSVCDLELIVNGAF